MKNIVILLLIAALAGVGYYVYQQEQSDKVTIEIGGGGISIQTD